MRLEISLFKKKKIKTLKELEMQIFGKYIGNYFDDRFFISVIFFNTSVKNIKHSLV